MPRFRIWSWVLNVALALIGIYFLKDVLLNAGLIWNGKKTLMLAAGISFPLLAIFLPKLSKHLSDPSQYEAFSKYLLQSTGWSLLVLFFMEILLRGVIQNPPLHRDVTNWVGDVPGLNSFVIWGKEGYGITHYKRWSEIQTPYADRNRKNDVIVLGDSHTEALQVGDGVKFVSVAESALRDKGFDLDLHNIGRSGLAIADYVSWIPPYKDIFRPKAIVVQLDISDFVDSFDDGQFNKFVVNSDGELELIPIFDFSPGFEQKQRRKITLYSQLSSLGRERWRLLWSSKDDHVDAISNGDATGTTLGQVDNLNAVDNTALEVLDPELFVKQMDLLLKASEDVPVIVVLLPYAPRILNGELVMDDPSQIALRDFFSTYYPDIVVVDPLPEFQKLALDGTLPRGFVNSLPGEGHLNASGHRIVGKLLADAIAQVLR